MMLGSIPRLCRYALKLVKVNNRAIISFIVNKIRGFTQVLFDALHSACTSKNWSR